MTTLRRSLDTVEPFPDNHLARVSAISKKQETERSELDSLMMTKIADKEYELNKDFQIRATEENDIEEAYHEKLQEYWKEKKDGDDEIESALLNLRKLMDQRAPPRFRPNWLYV
ncbi:hypothetical protein BKA56DRAFT_615030 [Ilyonectria sp. MPI-CAGE-AT-0026]|nr:hypothetical protein BKA56DRAFT_615030 [Ilyonectria sp. MPI-CAGE-AT-0026]